MHDPQGAHGLDDEIVELVGIGTAAGPGDGFEAIDGAALRIFLDEGVVAGLFDAGGDFVEGIVPRNVFPLRATGAADLWLGQTTIIQDVLLEGSALGAKRAAVNGMVGIAFDVDDLRSDVLGAVADGVDDHAAAYRAVGASGAGFIGPGDF